ncbi:hypothetical protein [Anaerobacillus alkalidiazotrophicus]|nr:hypothetical protein [Anaerobacillus alkalidiazotrophicus]
MKLLLGLLRSGFATSKRSGTGAAARDQGACAFLVTMYLLVKKV